MSKKDITVAYKDIKKEANLNIKCSFIESFPLSMVRNVPFLFTSSFQFFADALLPFLLSMAERSKRRAKEKEGKERKIFGIFQC